MSDPASENPPRQDAQKAEGGPLPPDAVPAHHEPDAAAAKAAAAAKRKTWLVRLAMGVGIIAVLWLLYWVLIGRNHVSTDDAYVAAESALVTPLSAGTVSKVNVSDTQFVKAGTILVEMDPATASIGLAQAQADLQAARRRYRQTVAQGRALQAQVQARGQDIVQAEAGLASARADADKARGDLARRQAVIGIGGVSKEELDTARKAVTEAEAMVRKAEAALAQARAGQLTATGQREANDALVTGVSEDNDPGVLAAKAKLGTAQIEYGHMIIRAPVDGIVTRRQVQIGQQVAVGQSLMTVVPVNQVYVDANFKERQLEKVRVGMPAEVVTDLYGSGVTFHGRVAGIAGGTGASQAIIPAQNATGNWIKVVQRLPVRITLDPKELAQHPLRVGLSTEVTIDLKD